MIRRIKHIISLSLVFILLMPMTVKMFDEVFHEHDDFRCTTKTDKHFHKHHEKCYISAFTLSVFTLAKEKPNVKIHLSYVAVSDLYNYVYKSNGSDFSFLLRGPPSFTA
ncbi:MAG TPA: hypothetical protein ENK85_05415 [Saprospiraceae bacterium]|nr:hypothetical protein [Saprospiraceae bacterium]